MQHSRMAQKEIGCQFFDSLAFLLLRYERIRYRIFYLAVFSQTRWLVAVVPLLQRNNKLENLENLVGTQEHAVHTTTNCARAILHVKLKYRVKYTYCVSSRKN